MMEPGQLRPEVDDVVDQGLEGLVVLDPVFLPGPNHDRSGPDQRHPEASVVRFLLHFFQKLFQNNVKFFLLFNKILF